MNKELEKILIEAKKASKEMLLVDSETKNKALYAIARTLRDNKYLIIKENEKDMAKAKASNMSIAMQDRLLLTVERIEKIASDVEKVANLNDPVGEVMRDIERPNGLHIQQVRVPIGVFGIIYESRPNVTVDIASLCLKSSNVCALKGGKEALYSNEILTSLIQKAINGILPESTVQLIPTDRSLVDELIQANDYVDVVVPRGGSGLISHVVKNATVPVIETGAGNCHLYIDKDADMEKAINISVNAKLQRPSVCNAIETILVHKDIAKEYLERLVDVFSEVEIRGDERVCQYIDCKKACEDDYKREFDDYIVAIKVVDDVYEAVEHIYKYSTKHSEAIVTENEQTAQYFLCALDSACVYVNASTRFSDGGEFGFGAELGISTQKLHARGPLGLSEMTSYQYRIYGNGQVRE